MENLYIDVQLSLRLMGAPGYRAAVKIKTVIIQPRMAQTKIPLALQT